MSYSGHNYDFFCQILEQLIAIADEDVSKGFVEDALRLLNQVSDILIYFGMPSSYRSSNILLIVAKTS
jgi:hypothetical protein